MSLCTPENSAIQKLSIIVIIGRNLAHSTVQPKAALEGLGELGFLYRSANGSLGEIGQNMAAVGAVFSCVQTMV